MNSNDYWTISQIYHDWCRYYAKRTADMALTGKANMSNEEFKTLQRDFDAKSAAQMELDKRFGEQVLRVDDAEERYERALVEMSQKTGMTREELLQTNEGRQVQMYVGVRQFKDAIECLKKLEPR